VVGILVGSIFPKYGTSVRLQGICPFFPKYGTSVRLQGICPLFTICRMLVSTSIWTDFHCWICDCHVYSSHFLGVIFDCWTFHHWIWLVCFYYYLFTLSIMVTWLNICDVRAMYIWRTNIRDHSHWIPVKCLLSLCPYIYIYIYIYMSQKSRLLCKNKHSVEI
jgi:hypothetical protein